MATTKKSTTKAKRKTTTKKKAVKKTPVKKVTAKTKTKTTKLAAAKKPKKKVTKSTQMHMPLKKLHVFLALASATVMGLLAAYGNNLIVGVTSSYLVENTLTNSGELIPAMRELFSVNLRYVAIGVVAAGFLWHTLLASKLFNVYTSQVKAKFTSLNWVEHALFGPWIIAIVAAAVGIRDVMTLLLIASIPAVTAVLGYLTDRYNLVGKQTALKTKIASEVLLLPWVVIGISILHTYLYGFITFPASIYAVLVAGFVVYVGLGFVHKKQILKQGYFADFIAAEQIVVALQAALLGILALIFFV